MNTPDVQSNHSESPANHEERPLEYPIVPERGRTAFNWLKQVFARAAVRDCVDVNDIDPYESDMSDETPTVVLPELIEPDRTQSTAPNVVTNNTSHQDYGKIMSDRFYTIFGFEKRKSDNDVGEYEKYNRKLIERHQHYSTNNKILVTLEQMWTSYNKNGFESGVAKIESVMPEVRQIVSEADREQQELAELLSDPKKHNDATAKHIRKVAKARSDVLIEQIDSYKTELNRLQQAFGPLQTTSSGLSANQIGERYKMLKLQDEIVLRHRLIALRAGDRYFDETKSGRLADIVGTLPKRHFKEPNPQLDRLAMETAVENPLQATYDRYLSMGFLGPVFRYLENSINQSIAEQFQKHGDLIPEDIDQIRNEIVSDVIDKILAREIANNPSLAVNRDDLKAKLVETLLVNLRR